MMTEATEKITATVLDELLMKMSDLDSIVRKMDYRMLKTNLDQIFYQMAYGSQLPKRSLQP